MFKKTIVLISCVICAVACKDETPKTNIKIKTTYGLYNYSIKDAYKTIDYSDLHSVAYMSYELDPKTGEAKTTHNWLTTPLIDSLHANSVKSLLTITNRGKANNKQFLNNQRAITACINNVITLIKARNADGIHINFEDLKASDSKQFTSFIITLKQSLKTHDANSLLYLSLPNELNNSMDFQELNSRVDTYLLTGNVNNLEELKDHLTTKSVPQHKLQVPVEF